MTEAAQSFASRRVLVTGASGVVGSWLVKALLDAGASVVGVIRDEPTGSELIASGDIDRITRVRGGVEDLRLLQRSVAEYEIDTIFHLAAQTQVQVADHDPIGTLEANVRGTWNILEAVRTHAPAAIVVIASSDKAYGPSSVLPYTESHPLAGQRMYEVSKSATDLIAASYARTYQLRIGIARCGNIYGGGDLNWARLIPGTIRSLLLGERPVLRSDGHPRRDYLYVWDAISGYLHLGEGLSQGAFAGEAFNFGHGAGVSVLDIVQTLTAVIGGSQLEPIVLGAADSEITDQWLDSSKAREQLAWSPTYSLADGLSETVAWYREMLRR
jgi:CDP-glucose 4,6-dehydratase